MFNFLKKKGKEKSNFFDNKVVCTPKSSKIFRKFVQSDMGQNSSLDKSTNKKTSKKSDSKDEEYNTAPNSPEIEKNNLFADSFLAIDDDSDLDSSHSLLQNSQDPSRQDPSSPSTSHDAKASLTPKPSVLLKSTPDAFYTKKNNNGNKRDLKSKLTNGSQNGSSSSKSFDESELSNNNNRRNSDSNRQDIANSKNSNNASKLSKQNSVDSVLSNARSSSSQTNGFVINTKKPDYLIDGKNAQINIKSDSKCSTDEKVDTSLLSNCNNTFLNSNPNKINGVIEDIKVQSIPEVNSRRESVDSVSESASIVVRARNTTLNNRVTDGNDSDTSLDSYSITASFEIKEASCEEKENVVNHSDEGIADNVTYVQCPESITIDTDHQVHNQEYLITRPALLNEINATELDENKERDSKESLTKTVQYSLELKTNEDVSTLPDSQLTNESEQSLIHRENRSSVDLALEINKGETLINKSLDSSMCLTDSSGEINNKQQSEPESSTPEPEFILGKTIEEVISRCYKETNDNISNDFKITDSKVEKEEQEIVPQTETEQSIQEEKENKEDSQDESNSEEESSEEEEKIEEEEENIEVPGISDVKQMDTDVISEEPPRKVKKFVRFALIHNTYHGSDTSDSEEEEDDDDEETEEEEEEEKEEEEDTEDVKDEVVTKKIEDETINSPTLPVALIKDDDAVIPVDIIVPESNENTNERVDPHVDEVRPQEDPFKNERLEYEAQIRSLHDEKADFEDRIHNLTSDLELKQLELNQLKGKIGELENQVLTKTWAMDRKEAELVSSSKESEHLRQKLRRLEDDLSEYRLKNSDLTEELVRKTAEEAKRKDREDTCDFFKIRELEEKLFDANEMIKTLEEQLNGINKNQEEAKTAEKIKKAETEVEMKIMREALDEALKQKSILQKRFESEFNQLRSTSTAQEQQLLDDFEWKLREVEQSCKKKILEAEKCKRDLEAQVVKLTAEVEELSKFKNVEAELGQLRSVSHEHQRTIRTITRQKEELQVNEKILNEEVTRLRAALEKEKNHITTLQAIHSREITEKNRKHVFKLEQQKNELQEQFEERLKKEALRVKVESEKHHLEDKRVAIEHTRTQADTKLQEQKKKWEKQLADAQRQVDNLKDRLKDSERNHRQEVECAQTHSDQNLLELRRKFDKLDMGYQEQIEKTQEKHEQEIERLTEEYDRRLGQCESSWQQQLSTTRTTLELVKEQMRRDSYEQVQQLKNQHQRELEEQWTRLIQERDEALAELEQRHRATIEQLRTEIEIRTKKSHPEAELRERVQQLEQDLMSSNILIQSLQSSLQASGNNSIQHQQQRLDTIQLFERSSESTPSSSSGLEIACLVEPSATTEFEIEVPLVLSRKYPTPLLQDKLPLSSDSLQSSEDMSLVLSTDISHSSLDYQQSFALIFIIFVILSYFLNSFLFPLLLSSLMFFFCLL